MSAAFTHALHSLPDQVVGVGLGDFACVLVALGTGAHVGVAVNIALDSESIKFDEILCW